MNHSNWNSCIDFERNEIVFENRNKLFGAYVIRRDYSRNVLLAFFTTCLFTGILISLFLIKPLPGQPHAFSEKFSEEISLERFTPPPIELTPPPVTPQASPSPVSKELTNPIVVDDKLVTTEVQMASVNPTTTLPSNGGEIIPTLATGVSVPVIPEPEKAATTWAENMPKFQGGDEKLMTYFSSHIRYPSKALANNIEGTVHVSFIVDTSGLITNVKLLRGIYDDCDLEALKGVSNMPKWIPGSQNGNKVRVQMSLPVRFTIK